MWINIPSGVIRQCQLIAYLIVIIIEINRYKGVVLLEEDNSLNDKEWVMCVLGKK